MTDEEWNKFGKKLGPRKELLAKALNARFDRFGSGGLTILLHWHKGRVTGVRLIEEVSIEPQDMGSNPLTKAG